MGRRTALYALFMFIIAGLDADHVGGDKTALQRHALPADIAKRRQHFINQACRCAVDLPEGSEVQTEASAPSCLVHVQARRHMSTFDPFWAYALPQRTLLPTCPGYAGESRLRYRLQCSMDPRVCSMARRGPEGSKDSQVSHKLLGDFDSRTCVCGPKCTGWALVT